MILTFTATAQARQTAAIVSHQNKHAASKSPAEDAFLTVSAKATEYANQLRLRHQNALLLNMGIAQAILNALLLLEVERLRWNHQLVPVPAKSPKTSSKHAAYRMTVKAAANAMTIFVQGSIGVRLTI